MARSSFGGFRKYVPVRKRREQARTKLETMRKAGHDPSPIEIEGRAITTTFWGGAWCDNLEAYSDFASRLPRGRTYVRNGSVLDLQIEPGMVRALVMGTELYEIEIVVAPLADERWAEVKRGCAGKIGSLVELLRGSLDRHVMEIVTRRDEGLFPTPGEIELDCSCPDWAYMCKHVAAALYGVGARLDREPELLFTLRGVSATDMVEAATEMRSAGAPRPRSERILPADDLGAVFGVEIEPVSGRGQRARTAKRLTKRRRVRRQRQ